MDEMSFMSWFKPNGPWALLFVGLFLYVLRTNDKRETRLLSALDKLADKYNIIEVVRKDVEEIKNIVFNRKGE